MDRRSFLWSGVRWVGCGAACGLAAVGQPGRQDRRQLQSAPCEKSALPPTRSVIPVVGDGRWIWKSPPEGQTGYLEPRTYRLSIGIQLQATGPTEQLQATTPAPVEFSEQRIDRVQLEMDRCQAELRPLTAEAGQLVLSADSLAEGQVAAAAAHFTLTLFKQYQGHAKEQFPVAQQFPKEFRQPYLTDSPGIQTRLPEVRQLVKALTAAFDHPWDKALAFKCWVWENIQARIGRYTSVQAALRDRVGDCEERAAVFVALCRASGIPARLVWVPNHNWAEFCLKDEQGEFHWIPAHTSCYSWFGWTGAHELVLQKGDSIPLPGKKPVRLVPDWMTWSGARPQVRFQAELTPLPATGGEDPGPGARRKDAKGEWCVTGEHEMDRYLRDGDRIKPPAEKQHLGGHKP